MTQSQELARRSPDVSDSHVRATYVVRSGAAQITQRAEALAVEQSVEMPLTAIADARVLNEVVAQVVEISELARDAFRVVIDHALEATTTDVAQLCNMLFGNSSLHSDVVLDDVELPKAFTSVLRGPAGGIARLRSETGANSRALAASALKPIGLDVEGFAALGHALALGGVDIVKDDHGLADQQRAPFAKRVPAVAAAIARANVATGGRTLYAPSLGGNLDQLRTQLTIVRDCGVRSILVAPMIIGLPTFQVVAQEARDLNILAHPALAGAQKISAPLLLGKIFRALGADATIFPNYGGRFSYSREICLGIAHQARCVDRDLKPCLPMPAGGMTLDRVPEMLEVYGHDCALLIGGALLAERENLTKAARAFADRLEAHGQA